MERSVSDIDITIARSNLALARSTKLIQSWLPPRKATTGGDELPINNSQDGDIDGEDDFTTQPENAGIGSNRSFDDEDNIPRRSKKSLLDDKLLEQLLGKKAAQAKRKAQDPGKAMSVKKHTAPKPLASRPKLTSMRDAGSDDEDEGGRSAAFKSRKIGKAQASPAGEAGRERNDVDQDGGLIGGSALRDVNASPQQQREGAAVEKSTGRKRGNTYLDDLLAQRAKKGKRKKAQT